MVPKYCFRVLVYHDPKHGVKVSERPQEHSFDHMRDAVSAHERYVRMARVKRTELLMVIDTLEKTGGT